MHCARTNVAPRALVMNVVKALDAEVWPRRFKPVVQSLAVVEAPCV